MTYKCNVLFNLQSNYRCTNCTWVTAVFHYTNENRFFMSLSIVVVVVVVVVAAAVAIAVVVVVVVVTVAVKIN